MTQYGQDHTFPKIQKPPPVPAARPKVGGSDNGTNSHRGSADPGSRTTNLSITNNPTLPSGIKNRSSRGK